MKKSSFLFLFFFYQLTFAQLSITGPSTISQNWPYVTFSNYCVSGDTGTYSTWTLPSSGGYFNFAYGSNNSQIIAAQTKIKVTPLNCVSWGNNASWRPFYNVPASISVTNGGMSATKTILMTPSTYGQTVQPLSTISKTGCASDSIIVGTVTSSSSNSRALQRTGPNEGCRLGHKWYYFDQNSGNWISFLTVNSQPSISSCSTTLSCLDSATGKTSQLFGYNVVDSTEWKNGIIKLDISQVPPNLADSLQVYLEVQHKQGVVLSSDTLSLSIAKQPNANILSNGFNWVLTGSASSFNTPFDSSFNYQWGVKGGIINFGQGTDSISVIWGIPDSNAGVWLNVSNSNTLGTPCQDSNFRKINVSGIGLDDNSLNSIILSPNPNSGLFSIIVGQEYIGSSYQILDNLGRLIHKGIIRELSQDFDLSEKPKGVYRIQVSNEKAIKTLNVVIQ